MLYLTLDTSTDPYFIILSKDKKIIASQLLPHQHNLSSSLIPTIEKIFKNTPYKLQDLSNIFVGVGPGSYTGVRVAVAVATSLSLALDIPLHPFCSLLAFFPENLQEGSFTFMAYSNHSSIFLLQGFIENKKISSLITHKLIEEKDFSSKIAPPSTVITLNPENTLQKWDIPSLKGSINLDLLLPYLSLLTNSPPLPPNIYYLHHF
ncbi:MAG: tRNA (adenosine(37)-N6)-threonylcarbamoyltransferase complex dimerization subunit type 1 TsaB [Chlamydiota bacterium]